MTVCSAQVYVRIRDEEWNVYRRYSDFLELHARIKKRFPAVAAVPFPPKKAIGNKVIHVGLFGKSSRWLLGAALQRKWFDQVSILT